MLTKYDNQQVRWLATSYDDYEYYWTESEYRVYLKACENTDLKILNFKDGSLAIGDIRRVEKYMPPIEKKKQHVIFTDSGFYMEDDYDQR